jgi:hypothetical protein
MVSELRLLNEKVEKDLEIRQELIRQPIHKISKSHMCEWALERNLCKHQTLLLSWSPMLHKRMSFTIVEHGSNLIM